MGGQGKRKRKVAVATVNEEKENESDTNPIATNEPAYNNGPMYKIMSHVQTSEALHKKYVKDLQQLYAKMNHDTFVSTFIQMIKAAMACDEANEYAMTSLQFCAKFVASFDTEETHPVLSSIFDWLLGTISNNPHIRFRLCQFINMILNALGTEAALDDIICDKILEYMVDRLLDCSPNVRLQAIWAMQRLQVPDNADDAVVRSYQFHLSSDPSPRVRMAVITCMGRNVLTIPCILDRLHDIDEKVRRHTYLQMSSYPVRSYKVSQRILLLEQGLNDRCEAVRKVASRIMLQQWFESYKKDLLLLIAALKLDATEADIERFRKVARQTLLEIFKREDHTFLVELLPFDVEETELHRCVPIDKLQMEVALYWQCLSEYLQNQNSDSFDSILPELSVFCNYTKKFCELQKSDMDKFENLEFQYKLLPLLEILYKYDLGDEIGRGNFKNLLEFLLKKVNLNDKNVEIIIRCAENIITDQNERMQFLINIVSDICQLNPAQSNLWQDRTSVNEAMANCTDSVLKMKLSKLKVKILELEEQEMTLLQNKNFVQAEKVTNEKNTVTEEFSTLLKPLLAQPLDIRKVKNEDIITGLQIIFHMIVSKKVASLTPQNCKLYNDFICRQMASTVTSIRIWALKCGTAFGMHFESIAKEVFNELYTQFFKNSIERIWEVSVKCIFEIIDLYGIERFERSEQTLSSISNTTSRRGGRLLYNTLENFDLDDSDQQVQLEGQEVGFIQLMSHFLDSLSTETVVSEIVLGFIKLILHGHMNNSDIIEKLLIRYFNPTTNTKTNQYLSIFMEEMIRLRKQVLLVPSLLPTINAVLTAPYDSPLLEIRPETITRFFIDITRQDAAHHIGRHNNLHNKIAHAFLTEMTNNVNNKDISKLLSKEILKLELNISNNPTLKNEMKEIAEKLLTCEYDGKTLKNLADFKDMLDGRFTRTTNAENETDEEADDETLTNENQPRTSNTTPAIEEATEKSNASTPAPSAIAEESEATLTETPLVADVEENVPSTSQDKPESATVLSNDESVASGMENSSQQSLPLSDSQLTAKEAPAAITKTPTVTTFGHQNKIGQRCLRRSLNNSCTPSESEASDAPKIRIELRIDSDKKKRPNEKSNTETKKKNSQATTASKLLNSASSRSLRMLRRQQNSKSPTDRRRKESKEASLAANTTETGSDEELNNSEIITQSPQATLNVTTRIFTTTRQRRGNAAALQSASSPSKPTANTNSSTRQSPQKTPTTSPRTPSGTNTIPSETPSRAEKTPQKQVSKTPSPKAKTPTPTKKTPQQQQNLKTPNSKTKTRTTAEKTPPQPEISKTPSSKPNTPKSNKKTTPQQQISKTPSPKAKTPNLSNTTITTTSPTPPQPEISKTPSSKPNTQKSNKKTTPQQQISKTPSPKAKTPNLSNPTITTTSPNTTRRATVISRSEVESDSSIAATKTPNRLPRKAIYISATTALQRTGKKRHLPKTPHPIKNRSSAISPSKSDSSSSNRSIRSPQPKQARRSLISPKRQTPPTHQKRLTAKDIESLLIESSDTSTSSSSSSTRTPAKKLTKPKASSTAKKVNNATKKSLDNTSASSNLSEGRKTRNKSKETYSQHNIMTRKRKSMHDSSSSGGMSSTQALSRKKSLKRQNIGAPSRIPIKSSQSSSTSSVRSSSRSSSSSPVRGRRHVITGAATTVDGFKQPAALRSSSLGRLRASRIPRKLP